MTRTMRIGPAAVLAVILAFLGSLLIRDPGEASAEGEQTMSVPEEARWDETTQGRVENAEAGPVEADGGHPTSITSPATLASPKDPPLEGRASETSLPRDSAMAGPPVSYTDPADDAYGLTAQPALSQPAFDILEVRWAPASEVDQQQRGYSSAITVAGTARNDGAYVTYGEFPSDVPGERCQLYNILTPGITAFANAFCGSTDNGTRRFIGSVQGSKVTSTRTAAGGTLLIATFDDSALPPLLESAGRMLFQLSAFTCAADPDGPAAGLRCGYWEILDEANTFRSYRL